MAGYGSKSGKLLKFHLIPIRDWNTHTQKNNPHANEGLKFHLIPIRDWNKLLELLNIPNILLKLKFHLIPIRDWNSFSIRKIA